MAWAFAQSPNDGSLVVKNGSAPKGVPVVTLVIKGAVDRPRHRARDDRDRRRDAAGSLQPRGHRLGLAQGPRHGDKWIGTNIKFRAVGGTYKITIYGSGVYLSAIGTGRVVSLAGIPDPGVGDGVYSLNDDRSTRSRESADPSAAGGADSNG